MLRPIADGETAVLRGDDVHNLLALKDLPPTAEWPDSPASGFTGLGSTTFLGLSAPNARQPLLLNAEIRVDSAKPLGAPSEQLPAGR